MSSSVQNGIRFKLLSCQLPVDSVLPCLLPSLILAASVLLRRHLRQRGDRAICRDVEVRTRLSLRCCLVCSGGRRRLGWRGGGVVSGDVWSQLDSRAPPQ